MKSGPAISFMWYYTVTLDPGDRACSTSPKLSLTWDAHDAGTTSLDCDTLTASGAYLPPPDDQSPGPHTFCVKSTSSIAPTTCGVFVIDPPGSNPPPISPPEVTPAATFEPDCIPTGKPVSPLCVTVTPYGGPLCDDGSHTVNSPPCSDAVTSTPTLAPTDTPTPIATPTLLPSATPITPPNPCATSAIATPTPPCITPSPTGPPTPAACPTIHLTLRAATSDAEITQIVRNATSIAVSATAITATATACATPTLTNGDDGSRGDSGVHVKWGAVAIAAASVVTLGGAAGGAWWWRVR